MLALRDEAEEVDVDNSDSRTLALAFNLFNSKRLTCSGVKLFVGSGSRGGGVLGRDMDMIEKMGGKARSGNRTQVFIIIFTPVKI